MNFYPKIPDNLTRKLLPFFVQYLLKLSFAALFPCLLFYGFVSYLSDEEIESRLSNEYQEMLELLSNVALESSTQKYFDRSFYQLSNIKYPSESFDKRLEQIFNTHHNALDIFLYDSKGISLQLPYMPPPPKYVAQRFLKTLTDEEVKSDRWAFQFSGYRNADKKLALSPNSLVELGGTHNRHWGGWFNLKDAEGNKSGDLIVFVKKSGISSDELLDNSLNKHLARYGKRYYFAWQNPAYPDVIHSHEGLDKESLIEKIISIPQGESRFYFENKPAYKFITDFGICIYAISRNPIEKAYLYKSLNRIILTVFILAAILLLPIFPNISWHTPKIHLRTALLLFAGASVSILLLLFTGYIDRSDREKVLIEDYRRKNLLELNQIDKGLLQDHRELEMSVDSIIKTSKEIPEHIFETELPNFYKRFFALKHMINEILLVYGEKSCSYKPLQNKLKISELTGSLDFYGEMLADYYNGKYYVEEYIPGNLRSLIRSASRIFSRNMLLSAGKLQKITFFNLDIISIFQLLMNNKQEAKATIFVHFLPQVIQRTYLHNYSKTKDLSTDLYEPAFVALPIIRNKEWPAFPKRITGENEALKSLSEQVMLSDLPEHQINTIAGKKYLFSAIKGSFIDGYILVLARPYKVIENEIRLLNRQLFRFVLMLLILVYISARISSNLLIAPLVQLKDALEAVNAGNFRHRTENAVVKDFSLMLSSLNNTLDKFHQLNIAQNIQSSILPQKTITGNTWALAGKNTTASELGGDHFDWLQLEDGRLFFAIGDVTGHGIAPAMIQATTKAWSAILASDCKDAGEFILKINRLHCMYGVKKLLMTFWAAYYNPQTRELNFASAGHSYPLLIKPDGTTEYLKAVGFPLGLTLKARTTNISTTLPLGSTLVLYTDGIIELPDSNNELFGYDRFMQLCSSIVHLEPTKAIEHILSSVNKWGKQNDDQTLLVLKVEDVESNA